MLKQAFFKNLHRKKNENSSGWPSQEQIRRFKKGKPHFYGKLLGVFKIFYSSQDETIKRDKSGFFQKIFTKKTKFSQISHNVTQKRKSVVLTEKKCIFINKFESFHDFLIGVIRLNDT